jgi:signal transduction histidine kinase
MRRMTGLPRLLSLIPCVLLWLALCPASMAQTSREADQRRILAIYSDTSTLTANVGIAEGLRAALNSALPRRHDLRTEFRATQDFPGEAEDARFVEMLQRKYADGEMDAVLAIGPAALRLVLAHRERFAPGVPVVAAGVTEGSHEAPLPDDVHVVRSFFDLDGTVALARRMQPDARRLVVFTGSAGFDDTWQEFAREALADEPGLAIDFVSGLTLSQFRERAAGLDPATILLILTIFQDASGARFIPAEAGKEIAAASAAPSWSVYRTFLDETGGTGGVVGGVVEPFEAIGRTLGELALDVLSGEAAANTVVEVPRSPVIDWNGLTRHGLDPGLLPDDAVLINYEPVFWERYRPLILAVLAVILAQTATIAALVILGRRWRAAQREMADQRLEMARLARVSQLGALSGAITHELNQPLTAILADAEAGAMLLRKSPPDIETVAEILRDIAEEDRRAARIISSLRNLMTRRRVAPVPVDLNDVATSVVRLTQSEAVMRDVRVTLRTAPRPLVVLGDTEQFQQIVVNLMLNGMDAMADQPPETRSLTVECRDMPDGRHAIAVEDTGPGLAAEVVDDPFRPFLTTKDGGLGMGLAICRTIAEAHRGTLDFVPVERGARAVFALPPA